MKFRWLYVMVVLYSGAGILHFVIPSFYMKIIPSWIPYPSLCVWFSGVIEMLLGIGLLPRQTRRYAAWLIVAMLVVFELLIHIPMAIDFANKGWMTECFLLLRILLQVVLIRWAWMYTRGRKIKMEESFGK